MHRGCSRELNSLPPLPTQTPPPPPSATPTPPICRAVVEGTFDNGLTLRETPGGVEVEILAEAAVETVIEEIESELDAMLLNSLSQLKK